MYLPTCITTFVDLSDLHKMSSLVGCAAAPCLAKVSASMLQSR